jgi:DNA-binding response OmpR family regulator
MGARAAATAGRPAAPDEPVLLVGTQPWWGPSRLERSMTTSGWAWITAEDVDRARWLASIRRVAMVVVGGDSAFRWQVVEAVRAIADAPLAVAADEPDDVVALLAAGVDIVVPTTESGDAVLARLAAVIRRADARRGPGVRYLHANDLVVDLWTQQIARRGEPVSLSPMCADSPVTVPAVARQA